MRIIIIHAMIQYDVMSFNLWISKQQIGLMCHNNYTASLYRFTFFIGMPVLRQKNVKDPTFNSLNQLIDLLYPSLSWMAIKGFVLFMLLSSNPQLFYYSAGL